MMNRYERARTKEEWDQLLESAGVAHPIVASLVVEFDRLEAELGIAQRALSDRTHFLDTIRDFIRLEGDFAEMGTYGDTYGKLVELVEMLRGKAVAAEEHRDRLAQQIYAALQSSAPDALRALEARTQEE